MCTINGMTFHAPPCMLSKNDKLRVIHFMIFLCSLAWEYSEAVHQFFIDFTKPCDSVRREVLYKFSLCLVYQ